MEQPKVALQVQGALELLAVLLDQQFDLDFVEQDDQLFDVDQQLALHH